MYTSQNSRRLCATLMVSARTILFPTTRALSGAGDFAIALALAHLLLLWPVASCCVSAATLQFEQLDYRGLTFDEPDSSWGLVTIDYVGMPETQYFNLNINGEWLVQNMPLESLLGVGEPQQLATFFDLGVDHGVSVTFVDHAFSIGSARRETMPGGILNAASVSDGTYEFGGVDAGAGGPALSKVGDQLGKPKKVECNSPVVRSVQLPKLNKIKNKPNLNQPFGKNDCVRGSVSNSLRYLQATGKIPKKLGKNPFPSTIQDAGKALGNTQSPAFTPGNWPSLKAMDPVYKKYINTQVVGIKKGRHGNFGFTEADLKKVADAIQRGHDVELEQRVKKDGKSTGHVMRIVSMKIKQNGQIDIGVQDDSQGDGKADPIKHYSIVRQSMPEDDNTGLFVNDIFVSRFVIESPRKQKKASRKKKKRRRKQRARGNGISYDADSQILHFSEDVVFDTGDPSDGLLGATVGMPGYRVAEIDPLKQTIVFDRVDLDPVTVFDGDKPLMLAEMPLLIYDGRENLFHGTMFDIGLGGVPASSAHFDPGLEPVESSFFGEVDALLDPMSPVHDPDGFLYFSFEPDFDFFEATAGLSQDGTIEGFNNMFVGNPVPEPSTIMLLVVGVALAAPRRMRGPRAGQRRRFRESGAE